MVRYMLFSIETTTAASEAQEREHGQRSKHLKKWSVYWLSFAGVRFWPVHQAPERERRVCVCGHDQTSPKTVPSHGTTLARRFGFSAKRRKLETGNLLGRQDRARAFSLSHTQTDTHIGTRLSPRMLLSGWFSPASADRSWSCTVASPAPSPPSCNIKLSSHNHTGSTLLAEK